MACAAISFFANGAPVMGSRLRSCTLPPTSTPPIFKRRPRQACPPKPVNASNGGFSPGGNKFPKVLVRFLLQPRRTGVEHIGFTAMGRARKSSASQIKRRIKQTDIMTRTARTLMISAAVAGMVAGTMGLAGCSSSDDSGKAAASSGSASAKHDCKGMNSCKGQGGCNSGDMGCKGKNSCKGKGGCKAA